MKANQNFNLQESMRENVGDSFGTLNPSQQPMGIGQARGQAGVDRGMTGMMAGFTSQDLKSRYNAQWALVIGSTKEIGDTWADRLASQGLNLVCVARSLGKLQGQAHRINQQYGVRVRMIACDLNDVTMSMDAIIRETQDLDIGVVINNASTYTWGRFIEQDPEYHRSVIAVNVSLTTALCHHFAQVLAKRPNGGALIMMSSVVASVPQPFLASYSASKAYITSLCETLYTELKDQNVDVLAVMPGATSTKSFRQRVLAFHRAGQTADVMSLSGADVVDKAISAIGAQPAVVVGAMNKLSDTLFSMLPRKISMSVVNLMTRLNFNDWTSGSKPYRRMQTADQTMRSSMPNQSQLGHRASAQFLS